MSANLSTRINRRLYRWRGNRQRTLKRELQHFHPVQPKSETTAGATTVAEQSLVPEQGTLSKPEMVGSRMNTFKTLP